MLNLLLAITTGSALFLSFLVFTLRNHVNIIANRWLAGFILLIGCLLLDNSISSFGIYQRIPYMFGILGLGIFAFAPVLYLGVSHFVSVEKKFKKKELWHFLPFLVFFILNLPFLFSSNDFKLKVINNPQHDFDLPNLIIIGLAMLQIFIYWALCLRKLRKHQRNIEQITAAPGESNLNWLRWLLYGIAAMVLLWIVDMWLYGLNSNATLATPGYLVLIWWLGYFALRQKEVFPFSEHEVLAIGQVMEESVNRKNSRKLLLSAEALKLHKSRLVNEMNTTKPYLDSSLNLSGLAKRMNLSIHEMSELINEGFGENFAQFVNRYRVEESKKLLLSKKHDHLSMIGIAFEAGFNSKTAFNTAFKKLTGISPSEFRQTSETESMANG